MADGSGDIGWQHMLREANQEADGLAKFGLSISMQVRIFDVPPSFICNPLMVDVSGICFSRGF